MILSEALSAGLMLAGAFFFFAGTAGLLRLRDVYSRLHALTKADNLGLGLIVAGLAIRADAWQEALKLIFIWVLVLWASATVCHLVARTALRGGIPIRGRTE